MVEGRGDGVAAGWPEGGREGTRRGLPTYRRVCLCVSTSLDLRERSRVCVCVCVYPARTRARTHASGVGGEGACGYTWTDKDRKSVV